MKIRTQFSLMTTVLIGAVVASIALAVTRSERKIIEAESAERLAAVTDGVVRLAQESLTGRDPLMLLSYLMFLQRERAELAFAAVTSEGHTSTIGEEAPDLVYLSRSVAAGSAAVEVKLGFRQAAIAAEVERALRPLIARTLGIAALFMALGILGAMTLSSLLTGPLLELSAAAAQVKEGSLDVTVPVKGRNEISALARKFNAMTARLKELVTFREDIMHTLTHELNTPLGGLQAYLEMWLEGGMPSEAARTEALSAMAATVARMEQSLQNALKLFKSTARVMQAEPKLVWIDELARDACRLFAATAKSKNVEVAGLTDEVSECAYCDEELLRQVVVNLVSNAIKYTPSGGKVTLTLDGDTREARFAVADTGPGIKPDDLRHIFTKFYRADSQERIPGTGLGLAIAHKAAQSIGGTITVESEVGKGTIFRVTIPKPEPEEIEAGEGL